MIETKILFVLAFCLLRFMHGASQAFVQVTTYSIIATCFKDSIAKVVGIIEFAWGGGIALGPLFAEFFYNIGGFELPLYVCSGFMLLLAVVTYATMTSDVEGNDKESSRTIHVTQDSVNTGDGSVDEDKKEKIPIYKLFTYKLFVFGV